MKRPVVYISGPITLGDRIEHYARGCWAESALMHSGFAPINPMRSIVLPHAWQVSSPHELWMEVDCAIVERCDAVLRLPGESKGADIEVEHAVRRNLPTFFLALETDNQYDFHGELARAIEMMRHWRNCEWKSLA